MKEVFLVPSEHKDKAEDLLRKDDLISRQSVTVRSAPYLDINESGFFIIIDGSIEAIKQAHALLDTIGSVYKHKEKVLEKLAEEEDRALSGFGNILGDN